MATQHDRPNRPRTKSMLSFTSHKSAGSGGKPAKIDLSETPKEKAHRRMTSKNDPTMAIRELQPGQAAYDETTIDSIRGIQHKDIHGNIITDPDRSNPTRPRMERPLETIRSFEAAIDGGYSRRLSARPESRQGGDMQSRRSSYYQGYGGPPARFGDGGYGPGANAGARMGPPRGESYNDGYNRASPAPAHFRDPRRMSTRNNSDPALYGNNAYGGGYQANHGYHQSYDAATTASGSGNSYGTEPWGNSTDPSSENSSVDRIPQQPPKPDLGEQYGLTGFGGGPDFQGPIMEEVSQGAPSYGQPGYGQQSQGRGIPGYPSAQNGYNGYSNQESDMPPPPPPHKQNAPANNRLQSNRKPLNDATTSRPQQGEKRKSWLKRTFSKNG